MDNKEKRLNSLERRWIHLFLGPMLALIAFAFTYAFDPFNFGSQQPLSAIPALVISVLILIVNQNISIDHELKKNTIYADRVYEAIKDYMHVTPVGSTEKATDYIFSRLPALREVKNTSFNLSNEIERADEKLYKTKSYEALNAKLPKYCTEGLIWKEIGDSHAVDRLRLCFSNVSVKPKSLNHGYKYRLISHAEPQINFIILEYPDGAREVLFNWDFRNNGQDPTVLISRDHQIIEMFTIQFEMLWQRSVIDHDSTATKSISVK